MTPEQLKASILQYAIQGKLVEQRPEEGTAEELYQQIQEEKQKLIKEGKIKKEKPLAEITEDEKPFDIPESWKWVKIGTVATVLGGKRIPAGRRLSPKDTGYVYIRVSDMKDGYVSTENLQYVPEDVFPSISKYIINKEDIFITVAGTIGRVGKIPPELDGANLTENADRLVFSLIDQDWLIKCLQSSMIQNQIANATTKVGQPKLAIIRIQNMLIPLPPLEEQHRIVAKIEELLPYVDRYATAYEKLKKFNEKFPEDMKKSILQYAIQGRLVEQRPEESTAEELYQQIQEEKQKLIKEGKIKKEKPLAEITEDEIPFDIPENWKWCRLSQIVDVRDGTHDSPKYVPEGIPLVTSKNLSEGTIDYGNVKYITQTDADKINERSAVVDDDILFAMIGSIGNPVLVKKDREFCIKNMALFKKYENTKIDMKYLYWFFYYAQYALKAEALGGVQSFISLTRFRGYLIPLPPYEEQKRIANKIEELLPYCEQLAK